MTITGNASADIDATAPRLLRDMLEERFAVRTDRLTELALCAAMPRHGGYDPRTLADLTAQARQAVADTAQALQRMSQGTYGVCEDCSRPIPAGRLHATPEARSCVPCARSGPSGSGS